MDTTIAQFQRQLHERDGEIIRLERELQTLRVCNVCQQYSWEGIAGCVVHVDVHGNLWLDAM